MSIVALRVFIYSVLPVLAATIHIALDKSQPPADPRDLPAIFSSIGASPR